LQQIAPLSSEFSVQRAALSLSPSKACSEYEGTAPPARLRTTYRGQYRHKYFVRQLVELPDSKSPGARHFAAKVVSNLLSCVDGTRSNSICGGVPGSDPSARAALIGLEGVFRPTDRAIFVGRQSDAVAPKHARQRWVKHRWDPSSFLCAGVYRGPILLRAG